MKKTLKLMTFVFCVVLAAAGCAGKYAGVIPGNYLSCSETGTFAGDTILVSGQASTPAGIETVSIKCDPWGVEKVYDLSADAPAVFNYDYRLAVPSTATFPQEIEVCVTSSNGERKIRTLSAVFAPDVTAPTFTVSFSSQIGVELDPATGQGVWKCKVTAKDDRALKSIKLEIPGISYSRTVAQRGRSGSFTDDVIFTSVQNYQAAITAEDETGNKSVINVELVVTPVEDQDPIDDFPQMYMFDAEEDCAEYIDGYFHYMYRQEGGYVYKCNIRAFKDGSKFYFTSEKHLDGNLFGASPYVSSKILNKKGYVVPVVIGEAGCYEFVINIRNQTYSCTPIDSKAIEGPFYISGVGFTNIADWGATDAMTALGNDVYSITMGIDGAAATHQYYYYTDGWATVYRSDEAGWEWFISAAGTCVKYSTDYAGDAVFYFDCALPWGWIKKN